MSRASRSIILAAAALTGCSYDWAIVAAPRDASALDAPPATDGAAETAAGDADDDSSSDATLDAGADVSQDDGAADAAVDCSSLGAMLDTEKAAAKVCTSTASDCMAKTYDQCGCTVYVAQASSMAAMKYVGDVATYVSECGDAGCAACPSPEPTMSFCLVGSSGLACNP